MSPFGTNSFHIRGASINGNAVKEWNKKQDDLLTLPSEWKPTSFLLPRVPNLLPNSTVWSRSCILLPLLFCSLTTTCFPNLRRKDGRDTLVQGVGVGSVSVGITNWASTSTDGLVSKRMGMGAYQRVAINSETDLDHLQQPQMNNTAGKNPCQMVASLDSWCLGLRRCPTQGIQVETTICGLPRPSLG